MKRLTIALLLLTLLPADADAGPFRRLFRLGRAVEGSPCAACQAPAPARYVTYAPPPAPVALAAGSAPAAPVIVARPLPAGPVFAPLCPNGRCPIR